MFLGGFGVRAGVVFLVLMESEPELFFSFAGVEVGAGVVFFNLLVSVSGVGVVFLDVQESELLLFFATPNPL